MSAEPIIVIDETIREGMQYRGLMFSYEQRRQIIEFQDALGVDISQAAYPPAHGSEKDILTRLQQDIAPGHHVRLAGLGRALPADVDVIAATGVTDIHIHLTAQNGSIADVSGVLRQAVDHTRHRVTDARIHVSLLDVGRTDPDRVLALARVLVDDCRIDMLSLPDTSGILAPDEVGDRIKGVVELAAGSATRIGVHCHNDMGMASANSLMGVAAGATVVELSALGIGERNGIGDLFLVGKHLRDKGCGLNLHVEQEDVFRRYYEYVDAICFQQTGEHLLGYRTPFFGDGVKTHVAGTHGRDDFGVARDEDYHLNVLCGRRLVEKFLSRHDIPCEPRSLSRLVAQIKSASAARGRALTPAEVRDLIEE